MDLPLLLAKVHFHLPGNDLKCGRYFCYTLYNNCNTNRCELQCQQPVGGIDLHVNADKTEYMCFNQRGDITTLKGGPLKLVDKFPYQGSSVSSTKKDINTWLAKAWTAIDRLSVIYVVRPD